MPYSSPQEEYRSKLLEADQAAALVPDGSNLILAMGAGMPPGFAKAMADRAAGGGVTHLPVYYMHGTADVVETLFRPDLLDVIRPHPLFMSSHDRALARKGEALGKSWVQYVPCMFHQAGRLLTETLSPDTFVVTVSPMDRHGYFSLGTNCDYGASVVRKAKRVIVEVNRNMPRTFGECLLSIASVDAVIEHDTPLMEVPAAAVKPEDEAIARTIAGLIPDGATLQMGVGALPARVLEQLREHNDLGLHSEVFSPSMVDLIRRRVLTGARKAIMAHKHVFTLALGDREMFDFMDDNPSIVGYPAAWVNEPNVIRKNVRMISVNAAIEVDLSGQVNAETMGGQQYSGTGGQLDFVRGAYNSPEGKSFIALHSTAKKGTLSRIVPELSNAAVTDTRMDVHHVVTEYGIADLKGRSMAERARMLIDLAHPDFRDDLTDHAKQRGLF